VSCEIIRKKVVLTLSALCIALATPGLGVDSYLQRPEVQQFIDELVREHKYDRKVLEGALDAAQYKQGIIDAITRPAEKRLEWWEYRRIFLKPARIRAGVEFWSTHAELMERIAERYQVDAHVIVAILGVETYYGNRTGSYRVVDSLATLGFDYAPRARFFRGQLREFFLLAREERRSPVEFTGSYAGAMGYGQFIPSSYRAYAVDFDQDGHRDIWNNVADAAGSVANYLKEHRWRYREDIVQPVTVSGKAFADKVNTGLSANTRVGELKALGVYTDLADDQSVGLVELGERDGPAYWLAQHNFYVITKYNRSRLYAMAVHDLAEAVAAGFADRMAGKDG